MGKGAAGFSANTNLPESSTFFQKAYRLIYLLLRKAGPNKSTVYISILSVLFSTAIRLFASAITGSPFTEGLYLAILIPLFLAPFLCYFILHGFMQLDQTEDALRKSEERFKALADLLPETIFEIDSRGMFTYINQNGLESLGYTRKDFQAGIDAFDITILGDDHKGQAYFQQIMAGHKIGLVEHSVKRKDGSTFPALFHSSAILDAGKPIGIRGCLVDMTEKHDLQKQVQRAQKMEAIGTLAGGVAHDLNNILAGLVSYPDLLLMQLPDDSPLQKPIRTIQSTGERAAALVQDLLTLARRGISATEIINMNEIISEYLDSPELADLKAQHTEIEIEVELDPNPLNIVGSALHLSKTVMNLICNAAEAMDRGGKILVATQNQYIDRPIRGYDTIEEGDYVVVSIKDTGSGIADSDIGQIFEPFFSKKKIGKSGTGLGLAVVWGAVKDHHGYIDVESSVGEGTAFRLYIPATRKQLAEDCSVCPIDTYKGCGESILVVDDIEEQRDIASKLLSELNYDVKTVASGEEAVDYLNVYAADLIILDMVMGTLNGLETYKKILEVRPEQRAIIASGYSETEEVKETQRLGAGPYVKKPYTLATIGVAVRSELDRPQ